MTLPSIAVLTAQGSGDNVADKAAKAVGPFVSWWQNHGGLVIVIPVIIVVAIFLRFLARFAIKRVTQRIVDAPLPMPASYRKRGQGVVDAQRRIAEQRRDQRAKTVGSVLGSIATVLIFATAFVLILGKLGINLGPIIASAGIVGLAIGFGAQSLVSDFLSGVFMLMEDQYGVGDWIDTGEASGTVEEVGLRVTQLRDGDGVLWFVRNGEIVRVGNYSQDWARAVLDIPVAYGEDVQRVSDLLKETAWTLWDDEDYKYDVLEEPEIWGVEVLSREAIVIRLAIKTAPAEQWAIGRELRRRVKEAFDRTGVQIPLQLQGVWTQTTQPSAAPLSGSGQPSGDSNGRRAGTDTSKLGE